MGADEGPEIMASPFVPSLLRGDGLRDLTKEVLEDRVGVEGASILPEVEEEEGELAS